MTDVINIRQASPADSDIVIGVLHEAAAWLEQTGKALWQPDDLRREHIVEDISDGLYFLAEGSDGIAGTVKYQLEDPIFWPDDPPGEAGYLHRLAVTRRYASRGASTAILRWAAERTQMLGRRYLRLDCMADRPRLRAVYERFGFQYHSDWHVGPLFVARYEYKVT